MTTNSVVRKSPRARTSWTFNESQSLNRGRSADPGLVPLYLITKPTFSNCHSPVGVHRPGAYRSERGVPQTPLLRRSCALRSKETTTRSLRSEFAAALTHQLLVSASPHFVQMSPLLGIVAAALSYLPSPTRYFNEPP